MLYNPSMAIPILATKFYIPSLPPKVVARPRLIEQLTESLSLGRKLTLISAPAGFGKTTLVSEWVATLTPSPLPVGEELVVRVAWLSLDENDNDPVRFLTYFIRALQTITPNLGAGILDVLQAPQSPSIESVLTALLNEIATIPNDCIFVLDDYHLVDSKAIDDALTFLVEHLPPQIHLVITTREDPTLPIPRLRARNQLIEIRAVDLRFTPSEATEFLNQVMGLGLSVEDVAILESRTEGWIASLQLAALSMKGQQDVHGFIQAFAGDHRYILDYLVEEVLQRQPDPIRNFLLQTSILERLNGPLCDAVTFQLGGKMQLESLQRDNLFLIPLDDQRHWYRYHHLFADVLRLHLMTEQPDQVPALHSRASEWYEQNGLATDAIHHALAAKDFERAANLIERVVPSMRRSRQETIVLGWLQALPDELFHDRPVLSVHHAEALLLNGKLEGVDARLRNAEQWLDAASDKSEMIVVDKDEFSHLPGMIAIYRAASALALGDEHTTMKYAQQALDFLPEEDHLGRGAAAGFLGLVSWRNGDLEAAHQAWTDSMVLLQRAGHIPDAIGCAIALADIRIAQGRLREAMSTYEQGLLLAAEHNVRGAADMHVGISALHREHNDLNTAIQHLLKSQELGEHTGLPQNRYRWRVAMARIREAQGNLDGALELLHEAERYYVSDYFPNIRPIAALKTRIWIAQGRLGEALGWAREQGLSVEDDLSYIREFEHITLTRLLIAQYKRDHEDHSLMDAMKLLERLLKAADEGGRTGSVIEILILQALTHQMRGDILTALAPLERALKLAEPEGYIRMFVDEGADIMQLLREAAAHEIVPDYAGKLLSAFGADQSLDVEMAPSAAPASTSLIEPLSQRELDILRLFKTELSGPEIAQELVIAVSTVRTHTKSIYNKLNVNSRRAAVKRAIELGLI